MRDRSWFDILDTATGEVTASVRGLAVFESNAIRDMNLYIFTVVDDDIDYVATADGDGRSQLLFRGEAVV